MSSRKPPCGISIRSCLVCVFTLAGSVLSLGSSRTTDDYIRTNFTVEDGLPDNIVNAIIQTGNGLLWVGTESGLASFDGREFIPIDLHIPGAPPQGAVDSLVEGSNGDLWVGTHAGVVLIPRSACSHAPSLSSQTRTLRRVVRKMLSVHDPGRSEPVSTVPVKRLAAPEEIAHVIAFVSSESASYVTGASIPVGGGMLAD